MKNLFRKTREEIISTLYPHRCPYCKEVLEHFDYACENCKETLPVQGVSHGINGGYRCTSALPYVDNYKRALFRFKFYSKHFYSKQLAYLMHKQILRAYPDMVFDMITFVPMHPFDEFLRGYNQSELLAKELSQTLKIPCTPTLFKQRYTKHQHNLEPARRKKNLQGAFKLIDKEIVKNKTILIVDDVVTTRSTLGECCKTLSKGKPLYTCCVTLLTTADLF